MPNMFRNFSYPGSDFHEMNLEWLFDACCRQTGLALNVSGNALRLVNSEGEVLSSVIVSYAEKALADKNGKDISTYIFSVAGVGDTVVFTKGDGTITSLTIPYADKAKYDIDGHEIEDYIYNVQVAGSKLRITHGDGTIAEITVPYALQATADAEGKDITTYAASLAVEGDKVTLRDSKGRLLNEITVPYATKALQDVDGDAIKSTYAGELTTGTTTVILKAKDGAVLDTITVPYATDASHADEADHATVATDATNAIETVAVSGDNIVFTTYGGTSYNITSPYSVKAQKDDLGNVIKNTYVANVVQDPGSGVLTFYNAMGVEVCHLTPVAGVALRDNLGNDLTDYIKSIVVSQNSDYVTVTHGDGQTDSLTIHYSETAWKDTNGNVIKNTYIKYLECIEDVDDGHYKIVAYNGDTPMAELFRFEVTAYSAQTDINGKDLTTYVADVSYNAGQEIEVKDGGGNLLNTLRNALDDLSDVETNQLLTAGDLLGYDGNDWTNVALEVALDDLTDVTIDANTLADGDVLTYDANSDEWVNKPAGGSSVAYTVVYKVPDTIVQQAISGGVSATDFYGIITWCMQNTAYGQWDGGKSSGQLFGLEATVVQAIDGSDIQTATASLIQNLWKSGQITGVEIVENRDAYNQNAKHLDAVSMSAAVGNGAIRGVMTSLGYNGGSDYLLQFASGGNITEGTITLKDIT